jgi:hypothetical protein
MVDTPAEFQEAMTIGSSPMFRFSLVVLRLEEGPTMSKDRLMRAIDGFVYVSCEQKARKCHGT